MTSRVENATTSLHIQLLTEEESSFQSVCMIRQQNFGII